jgi:hypothetical protein
VPLTRLFPLLAGLLVLPGFALGGSAGPSAADLEFFEKRIRPLLAERCHECHSVAGKTKAGLRLDVASGWLQGGDSGPALLPGKVEESILIKAVRYTGLEVEAMPPKTALGKEEVALLEEWVRRGAPAPVDEGGAPVARLGGMTVEEGRRFWSFVPPAVVPLPEAGVAGGWARTPLDRFVAAGWSARGLTPAPDADRATLFRRLAFDLLGLPPELAELEAFVADRGPGALERVVDRLLASPHFGERWGRHWLDVVRFAESSGGGRTLLFKDAWRYRDYVIEAFNRDLPFDQFIREQLAGDLLPAADLEQRRRRLVATGFLALGPTNYEEQNKGALRMDIVDEQLDTLGKAFLGMTIGCARCHDHKFDPIPTRDYYALAGILRSTHTLHNYTDNVAKWVEVSLPLEPEAERAAAEHEQRVAELEKAIRRLKGSAKGRTAVARNVGPRDLAGIVVDDAQARMVGDWKASRSTPGFVGDGYLSDDNAAKGAKTATFTPVIPRSGRYEVRLAYTASANRASNVPVTVFHADGENLVVVNQRAAPPVDEHFISLGHYRFEREGQGYVLVSNEGTDGYVIVDALQLLPADERRDAVAVGAPDRKQRAQEADLNRLEAELRKLNAAGPRRLQAMGVREATGEIGDTEIRIRGVTRNLGPKVPRGFLQVASPGPVPEIPAEESGRRQLADWIASPANPLTARVFVNRAWAWLMGAGLAPSVDNLGTTGDRPTHPELLDHLARQFVAEGWSVKRLVRAIVLSRTYGLSSVPGADAVQRDPDNRLLSHARRRRLEAEEIRDAILATSGQLDRSVGGPNIGPGGAAVTSEYGYVFADTRRSVYTPAFRNRRLELFEVFDFADINAPQGQRAATTVAPQALYLLNHPFVLEQARAAAGRSAAAAGSDDRARIDHAYRMALGRPPRPGELALARSFLGAAAPDPKAREEAWTILHQSLLACVDFRYLN